MLVPQRYLSVCAGGRGSVRLRVLGLVAPHVLLRVEISEYGEAAAAAAASA